MSRLEVLIVGGGVAGPALAHWLSRIGGAHITLVERSPRMRASGQQVDLRAQGVPMMRRMGIEAAVRAAAVREPGTQLVDKNGRTRAFFPAAAGAGDGGRQSFTSEFEIMRGDMVRILYGLTAGKDNVTHLFDTTIDSFTQDEEGDPNGKVHVTFQDGRNEDFDMVVGADGTASRTRRLMLGPDAPDPRHHLGGYIGYFSILSDPGDPERGTLCHLGGLPVSRVIGTRKDCAELTRVYMLIHGKHPMLDPLDAAIRSKDKDVAQLKEAWARLYDGAGWQCDRFTDALRHAPEADDLYCTPYEEVRLPVGSWSRGRVVLVGDAAHCQTAGGFGTTLGLIGPYILAGEIAKQLLEADGASPTAAAVTRAAELYEEKFRPIATASHGDKKNNLESLLWPRSGLGIGLLHTIAGLAAYFRLEHAAGFEDKASKWELPDYPELERQ